MTNTTETPLKITCSPHLRTPQSVNRIMWTVNIALAPAGLFAAYWFGWRALYTIALCVGSAILTEFLIQRFRKVQVTCFDGSAVLTGLLFAYVMPANQPWFVSIFGSAFAIGIAKHAFGGLGNNIWNPALVARAFVLAAWPAVTILGASWPLMGPEATPGLYDLNDYRTVEAPVSVTAPSPLTDPEISIDEAEELELAKAEDPEAARLALIREKWEAKVEENLRLSTGLEPRASDAAVYGMLFFGFRNGCLGETSAALMILGGIVLLILGYINWRVPLFFIGSALLLAWLLPERIRLADGTAAWSAWFSGDMLRQLFGGGLLLGAFFMATDMVTSPVSNKGAIIFAVGCGVITALIRNVGGYPEGVSYSIILMNTAVPLIDRHTRPRTYGEVDG